MKVRGWKLELSEDRPSIDIVEEGVIVVGNIREAAIVEKHILNLSSPFRLINTNKRGWIVHGIS